ncbi:MAG: VanZ family protein [Ferruginibacter sp.]
MSFWQIFVTSKAKNCIILYALPLLPLFGGYTTEILQKFYIPGRSYDLADWLADSIGGILALIICKFYFLRRSKTGK